MREPKCAICIDPALSIAVKELRADGLGIVTIAERLKRSKSSVHRHLQHQQEATTKPASRGPRGKLSQTGRRDKAGRCSSCGLSATASDTESLMRRAERLLWLAETIAAQAHEDNDARLALMACDKARQALETMMRASGMIGGDGSVVVNVDARRIESQLAQLSAQELRALATGKALPATIEGEAC